MEKHFTTKWIDEPDMNFRIDIEIEVTGEWEDYCGMRNCRINFWKIINGKKQEENYYNDKQLGALVEMEDGIYWTNDFDEAFHNGRMWKIEKI